MKKILVLFIFIFVLTGCSNSINLDFNDKVDASIHLSFSKKDFEENIRQLEVGENLEYAVEDILIEARPIIDNYDELFEKEYFKVNNDNLEAKYNYSYTYDSFINNDLFNKCFEYPVVEDLNSSIGVYLSGNSKCGEFKITVKADKRMISNNSDSKENDEYVWNVKKENNDIRFTISKDKIKSQTNFLEVIAYILLAIIAVVGVYLFSKHLKKKQN